MVSDKKVNERLIKVSWHSSFFFCSCYVFQLFYSYISEATCIYSAMTWSNLSNINGIVEQADCKANRLRATVIALVN